MKTLRLAALAAVLGIIGLPAESDAASFVFDNLTPNNLMAAASQPSRPGGVETETADDFLTASTTTLTSASFVGLLPLGLSLASVSNVGVEIYRVFPHDSLSPPSGQVPTRTNSPSDVAFAGRDAASSDLSFAISVLTGSFTSLNSVVNGINPIPGQTTAGEGPVTGQEVQFDVTFLTPIVLPADHYFFVPQVQLMSGDFLWLSASRPISGSGTTPFSPDLQAWIRNDNLAPDWLRIGTDIVGGSPAPTFNMAFSLNGTTEATPVPEPATLTLVGAGLVWARRRAARRS